MSEEMKENNLSTRLREAAIEANNLNIICADLYSFIVKFLEEKVSEGYATHENDIDHKEIYIINFILDFDELPIKTKSLLEKSNQKDKLDVLTKSGEAYKQCWLKIVETLQEKFKQEGFKIVEIEANCIDKKCQLVFAF